MTPPRAALYARVSTSGQVTNDPWASLPQQLADLRALAERLGFVVALEVEEQGSGAKQDRPGWQRVLAAARTGEVGVIMAVAFDRLTRSERLADFEALKDELRALGVRVVTLKQGELDLSGTADAETLGDFHAVLSKRERLVIRERTTRGRRAKAAAGGYAGGATPFGYRAFYDAATGGRRFAVDEDHAAVVRDVFRRFLAGERASGITVSLNRAGVPAPGGPWADQAGRHWHQSTVMYILENRVYAGLQQWRPDLNVDTAALDFPPLIERETWERAQRELVVRAVRQSRGPGTPFPLSGILRCQGCGRGMNRHKGAQTRGAPDYYRCSYDERSSPDPCPHRQHVRQDLAEETVRAFLVEHLSQLLGEDGRRAVSGRRREPSPNRSALDRELARAEARQAALVDMMIDMPAGREAAAKKLADLDARIAGLREAIAASTRVTPTPIDRSVLRPLVAMLEDPLAHEPANLRRLFEQTLARVVLVRTSLPPRSRPARLAVAMVEWRHGDVWEPMG